MGGMDNTCSTGCGRPTFPFGIAQRSLAFVVVPLLAVAPLICLIFVPIASRVVGGLMGWYLRNKTDGRRSQLLQVMEEDERQFQEGRHKNTSAEGEGARSHAAVALRDEKKAPAGWDGIIGFFHPFWYALPRVTDEPF